MNTTYPGLVNRFIKNNPSLNSSAYKWVVAFYWVTEKNEYNPADKKQRDGFYVIPSVIDTKTGKVVDYLDDYKNGGKIYSTSKTVTAGGTDNNAYNAGHLYP
jgi:hypothetical protein